MTHLGTGSLKTKNMQTLDAPWHWCSTYRRLAFHIWGAGVLHLGRWRSTSGGLVFYTCVGPVFHISGVRCSTSRQLAFHIMVGARCFTSGRLVLYLERAGALHLGAGVLHLGGRRSTSGGLVFYISGAGVLHLWRSTSLAFYVSGVLRLGRSTSLAFGLLAF